MIRKRLMSVCLALELCCVTVNRNIANNHFIYNRENGTFSGDGTLHNAADTGNFYNYGTVDSGITVIGDTIRHFVTGVTLTGPLTMTVGDTVTITASLVSSNATERGMTWTSSDTTIATVEAAA